MPYLLDAVACQDYGLASRKVWLLTNGTGGYAMGTAAGANLSRYHGHLVARIGPEMRRMVLLANVEAFVTAEEKTVGISTNQYRGTVHPQGYTLLSAFKAGRSAVWRYELGAMAIAKTLTLHPGAAACTVRYANLGDSRLELALRPLVCHRDHHHLMSASGAYPERQEFMAEHTVIEHAGLKLVLAHPRATRLPALGWYYRFEFPHDQERGFDGGDDLCCPCELRYSLAPGEEAVLVASAGEPAEPIGVPPEAVADQPLGAALEEAARHFIVEGPERPGIVAGFPWFGEWGRDTMISIPGLCLRAGRARLAREIIAGYLEHLCEGLIPNRFNEQGGGEYNTVDAGLWLAQAAYESLLREWDKPFAWLCMDALRQMTRAYANGSRYGIRVDPADGLLTQGAAGAQLTWMDAKIGDWVVTPRHGKPVEVNGLWINLLRIAEWLAEQLGQSAAEYRAAAIKAESAFYPKFWRDSLGYFLDTCEPDDATLRPNQLIAMSLPFGPARDANARIALSKVKNELLTEHGLRTLSSEDPRYRGRFEGSLAERDAAYHQGTVWPWLFGPYCRALLALEGDYEAVRRLILPAAEWLKEAGLGGIAEVYDGDGPQRPGGCLWQAWSVAEVLEVWCRLETPELTTAANC